MTPEQELEPKPDVIVQGNNNEYPAHPLSMQVQGRRIHSGRMRIDYPVVVQSTLPEQTVENIVALR